MRYSKTKTRTVAISAIAVALLASACSSGGEDSGTTSAAPASVSAMAEPSSTTVPPSTTAASGSAVETVSVVVPFMAANGQGTVEISGDDSPVAVWFSNQPGEISLDLVDADAADDVSVVEELASFWFFRDDGSGDVPPTVFVSAGGVISDSLGTRYVVEAEGLPAAPGTETTTATADVEAGSSDAAASATTEAASPATAAPQPTTEPEDPETSATSEPPVATTTTTTASPPPTSTATTVESPVVLQVQVLNGSGVAGAAGRLTDKLSEAGYAVLSPDNAPQRYASSAVYFAEGWEDEAEEILDTADIGEIDGVTAMPQQFASEDAAVVVLLGRDTAPAIAREQSGLRPRPNFDVTLPLGDDVPRDRFVPGVANIQIFTEATDNDEYLFALAHTLQGWMRFLGNHAHDYVFGVIPEERGTREQVEEAYRTIEGILRDFGFTPQNVCGAPAGYSFTDLLQPTREWDENLKTYAGDAIFTTDRLIELHGGERINPEENLEFYIREAVQTAHDAWRISELMAETEAMQLILCEAWISPSGEIPEAASSLWYANLTPGTQPQESLMSQGTYHFKEISRNGNYAYLIVCHPTIGERYVRMWWRENGYRAEVTGSIQNNGCQETYERDTYLYEDTNGAEDTIRFGFGDRAFSGSGLSDFPRN